MSYRHSILWLTPLIFLLGSVWPGPLGARDDLPSVPDGVDPDWMRAAIEHVRSAEYHFSPGEDGGLSAPNRARGLRTSVDRDGITLAPRRALDDSWSLTLRTVRFGRLGALEPVPPAVWTGHQSRVEHKTPTISEWIINTERGAKHGFTIDRSPEPTEDPEAPISIEMIAGGTLSPRPTASSGSVWFHDAAGRLIVHYTGLVVEDATGARLPASLSARGDTIAISVDDRDAIYPLSIDPLFVVPDFASDGLAGVSGGSVGRSVATAGDVNGDGYSDLIVGAPDSWDPAVGLTATGIAIVYYGSPDGVTPALPTVLHGVAAGDGFGCAVSTAGDVNRDGYDDVVVGAPFVDLGTVDHGRVSLFLGSATGISALPATVAVGTGTGKQLGTSVSTAGDVNGDGYADVIAGGRGTGTTGEAHVYLGSAGGLASAPIWTETAEQTSGDFGIAVSTAGDVNADGFADIVIGDSTFDEVPFTSPNHGKVYVYYGSIAGPSLTPDWTFLGEVDSWTGSSVSTAGDVNGDGFADVVVGADNFGPGPSAEGRAYVFHGSSTGLLPMPSWFVDGSDDERLGAAVATAGDVNGDGYADVIIGSPWHEETLASEGAVFVYLGSPTGLEIEPDSTLLGEESAAQLGTAVATAGDVNGDGFSDIAVGAPNWSSGPVSPDTGLALVYHGKGRLPNLSADLVREANQPGAALGTSVACAGDVNGDGLSDLVIGAPAYDVGLFDQGRVFVFHGSVFGPSIVANWTHDGSQILGRYGWSVSSAGDVNGDGYADVIIGAPFESNGPLTIAGHIEVFHGSASGVAGAPAFTFSGIQANAAFGYSVTTAGDLDADGFCDIAIGAPGYSNPQVGEGGVIVYRGSSSGLAVTTGWVGESDQAGANLGFSVANAGDVNGDGLSDLIAGAPLYDGGQVDEGAAFVWHGDSMVGSGGTIVDADWSAEGEQAGASFGFSVASAGDVNGDAFSDVVIGAWLYDGGTTPTYLDGGAAFAYSGSSFGLDLDPAWMQYAVEDEAQYGRSVACAGDVNGDGYSDVIIGAPFHDFLGVDNGMAFIYRGTPTGLFGNHSWFAFGTTLTVDGDLFGTSVAGAGDVNGDGYADVVIGAPFYANGSVDEGGAFVFYGNAGGGVPRLPEQLQPNGIAPIAWLGEANGNHFTLRARGRTAAGRGRLRLEWEIDFAGVGLDGSNLETSALELDTGFPVGGASSTVLDDPIVDLDPFTPYHWRLRIRSDNPLFPHSPWFTLPATSPQITQLRTGPEVVGIGTLICSFDPDQGGMLTWTTDPVLTGIEIRRDSELIATLPGTATDYLDPFAVSGAVHEYTVTGLVGAIPAPPATCILFAVAGETFTRGDCNDSGAFDIADAVFLLSELFSGGPAGPCDDACDANDDGQKNIADAISILATLFSGGPDPTAPFGACGLDPTTDGLDCAASDPCP